MCYLFLILRVFLKRKFQPKSVLKGVVSFIYSIDTDIYSTICHTAICYPVIPLLRSGYMLSRYPTFEVRRYVPLSGIGYVFVQVLGYLGM